MVLQTLVNAVLYLTLAPYNNEQSDLIHRVQADPVLDDLKTYKLVMLRLAQNEFGSVIMKITSVSVSVMTELVSVLVRFGFGSVNRTLFSLFCMKKGVSTTESVQLLTETNRFDNNRQGSVKTERRFGFGKVSVRFG